MLSLEREAKFSVVGQLNIIIRARSQVVWYRRTIKYYHQLSQEDKMLSPELEAKRELCHRLDLPRLETSGC